MTALPQDVVADLSRLVAELEQRSNPALSPRPGDRPAGRAARKTPGCRAIAPDAGRQADCRDDRCSRDRRDHRRLFGASERHGSGSPRARNGDARSTSVAARKRIATERSRRHSCGSEAATCRAPSSRENRQIHIPDLDHLDPDDGRLARLPRARAAGISNRFRHAAAARGPGDRCLSSSIATSSALHREELALQQSFADQAVIAIENARLFNETAGSAGAADRDRRHPEGHRQFALGRAAGFRGHRDQRQPAGRRVLDGGAALCRRQPAPRGVHANQPGGR